jgi:hypothetical protein
MALKLLGNLRSSTEFGRFGLFTAQSNHGILFKLWFSDAGLGELLRGVRQAGGRCGSAP